MDHVDSYKWAELDEVEQKDAYRRLLNDYREVVKMRDAFVKLASRLSDY
jgi:hypothetical protein